MRKLTQWLIIALTFLVTLPSMATTFVGERSDFRDETIYFAMTTRFYDGDPKNNVCTWDKQEKQIATNDPAWRGDFAGLIEKLDYIKALGFTAIWITPVVQNGSGIDYHGYHAMDMSSVDLRYESRTEWGSEKDVKFQDLIDAAHAKGLKIVLDVVLQHTGNFGEANLNPLFTRNQNIRNQANIECSMIPDEKLGGASYWDLPNSGETTQYSVRWKYFKNPQYEPNNYYHHYGTGWNWDLPNRWWGQIAGDCVDLNTENNAVAEYVVDCYGKFIEMGVDAFRIDTSGHISPLTFNKQFIPQFQALGEKYKRKRLNGAPVYMFGEVCQRFPGTVVYRDQPNLSCYFYTWKSDQALLDEFNGDPAWWRQQNLPEGHDTPVGPMAVCEKDTQDKPRSNNAWMQNGAWHEPDYSQASGFNVIDFPIHYSYKNVGEIQQYFKQDNYYNDASFNVVYVDSHDYGPGPNDGIRFNGGTAQWAENLSWMFTFRGIPCLYYGSEVEFQAGKLIDDGMNTALINTGRAYFGHYLEGNVKATDFAQYTADGQVAATLKGDLAHHIQQLNKIRAAVPALRKGQYTFDGCSANGGWAFKRAYKDESYALVAVNGGATFTNVPAGTYTDIVTGQTYQGGGTITVTAPATQGQLRVLVKDWNGGKVVEDGKFIYTTSPVAQGGTPTATDPGASFYYTKDDAIDETPGVIFSPAGGTFKTETLTVSVSLTPASVSGWYQVAGQQKVNITSGNTSTFTIGAGMSFGESISVTYGATSQSGDTTTGTVTYKKVDPTASITVYVDGPQGTNMYAWGKNGVGTTVSPCGEWPGKALSETVNVNGTDYYYVTFDDMESVNIILNKDGNQTGDIEGITEDTFFKYDGNSTVTKVNEDVTPVPVVKFSPNGGNFVNNVKVTATASNATSAWYKIGNGQQINISGSATFSLGDGIAIGESVTVYWSASSATETKTGSVTFKKVEEQVLPEGLTVYYDNSVTKWGSVKVHYWGGESATEWPGVDMQMVASNIYMYTCPKGTTGVVFNNGGGDQTNDIEPENNHIYKGTGNHQYVDGGSYSSSVADTFLDADDEPVEYYNIQGIRVDNPTPGFYIMRKGNKVQKVHVF